MSTRVRACAFQCDLGGVIMAPVGGGGVSITMRTTYSKHTPTPLLSPPPAVGSGAVGFLLG